MKPDFILRGMFCFATAALLGAALSALAAEVPANPLLRLRALALKSDLVLVARCVEARSFWDEERRLVMTAVKLQSLRTIKGAHTPEVEVRILGGRVGDLALGASHAVTVAPGEEMLGFLRPSAHGPYHVFTGGDEGKLTITEGTVPVGRGALIPLDDLTNDLRRFLESQ
jgi:hypothetical protein